MLIASNENSCEGFLFELLLTIFGYELGMELLGPMLILLAFEDKAHSPIIVSHLVPMLSLEDFNLSAYLSDTKRIIMVIPVGMRWRAVVLIGSSLMTLMTKIFSCPHRYLWVSGEIGF